MTRPSLHLLKLFVGLSDLEGLARFQQRKLETTAAQGLPGELTHITLRMPKRTDELLDGGSIYWVMSGTIVGRQRLVAFRPITVNDIVHCQIVYGPALVAVTPRPHRPFQGWRYLEGTDAPDDLGEGERAALPPALAADLSRLGLI